VGVSLPLQSEGRSVVPAPRRTDQQLRDALKAVEEHGSVKAAARALKMPPETLRHRVHAAQARYPDGLIEQPRDLPYEDAWQRWMKAIGMARDKYAGPPKKRAAGKRERWVAAGDFHVPFHSRDAVAELIAREAATTDVLFLGGDFGDAYGASIFTKYEHVPFRVEQAETTACMQMLSENFQRIKYLRGSNHMDRVEKRLREALNSDMLEAVLSMTGGELSPDLVLVKRFPNIEVADWHTPDGQRVGWFSVIGDVAFSHAEKYSRVPGAAMRSVDEWFEDYAGTLGLPPVRALVQFHTHAMGLLPWRSDRVLIEPGCMCTTHGYQLRSKIGGRPQRVGYVVFEMEDGRIDFDSIRLRWLNRRGGAEAA
jgi:hypothetical protein